MLHVRETPESGGEHTADDSAAELEGGDVAACCSVHDAGSARGRPEAGHRGDGVAVYGGDEERLCVGVVGRRELDENAQRRVLAREHSGRGVPATPGTAPGPGGCCAAQRDDDEVADAVRRHVELPLAKSVQQGLASATSNAWRHELREDLLACEPRPHVASERLHAQQTQRLGELRGR